MIRNYISFLLLIFATVATQAQTAMTLDQCRQQAVAYNKELKNADLQKQQAEEYKKVARTAYLPKVEASANLLHAMGIDDIGTNGGLLPTATSNEAGAMGQYSGQSNVYSPGMNIEMGDISVLYGSLSVMQPIYTGGKILYANKQASTGADMASNGYQLKYTQVIEQTDQAFWNIAIITANIELVNEYITMLTELEQKMTDMYDLGLVPASEKLKVSVKKNEAQLNLLRAENGLKMSKMHLNQVIGLDLSTDIAITYDTESDIQLLTMDSGLNDAFAKRSEIKLMQNKVDLSKYQKKSEMAEYLPQVGVGFQYSGAYVSDFMDDPSFHPMLAAQVTIPLFAWGQGKHKQQAAELKIRQAETNLSNTNDLINLEVLSVQIKVEEAFEAIQLAEKNLKEANESLDETKASFEVGLNTTTELLNAQADWQKASSQLVLATAQYRVLETSWARATGTLELTAKNAQ